MDRNSWSVYLYVTSYPIADNSAFSELYVAFTYLGIP